MTAFLARRVLRLVVVATGVSLVTFLILHSSGDPVALMMPDSPVAEREALRQALGLDDPIAVQLARFAADAVRGRFGDSLYHREPAMSLVLARMPTTLTLAGLAMGIALLIAVPAGTFTALRRGSSADHAVTVAVLLGQSMPVFWTGIMLILLFGVTWRVLPVSGWATWSAVVLPALTLGAALAPIQLRIVRSSMLEVIGLDYVRTARAKGLAERAVIWRHALRNAALPVVTVIGLQFGFVLGGAVVIETVFAIPGVGRLIVSAIGQLDFPVVQASVFLLAMIVVTINFAVDVLYTWLDPVVRVRWR
jgi:ABC-type dipeptide/oligopeptide/nickel transport system permease component